jgi:hypothetical protein
MRISVIIQSDLCYKLYVEIYNIGHVGRMPFGMDWVKAILLITVFGLSFIRLT